MSPEDTLESIERAAAVDEAVIRAAERTDAYKSLPGHLQAMVSTGMMTLGDVYGALGYGRKVRGGAKPPPEEIQEEIKLEAELKRLKKQAKRMGIKNVNKMGVTDLVEAMAELS